MKKQRICTNTQQSAMSFSQKIAGDIKRNDNIQCADVYKFITAYITWNKRITKERVKGNISKFKFPYGGFVINQKWAYEELLVNFICVSV